MRTLIILASIIAFSFAVVIFGGAIASDATARARNAAANEIQAKAALEIARGQSEAIITRANADAYSDRALASVPIWIMVFVLAIVCLVGAIVVIVRFSERGSTATRQAEDIPVIVFINGQPAKILLQPGQTRKEQIEAALELAYRFDGGIVDSRLVERSQSVVRH
jgi:hypothetical protein